MNDDSLEVQSQDRAVWEQPVVFRSKRLRSDEVLDRYSALCGTHVSGDYQALRTDVVRTAVKESVVASITIDKFGDGPGIRGEGRPKEEEGELRGETLRKRNVQRMPGDTGWGQDTCCTGLGVPVVGPWHPQGDQVLCPGLTWWPI